MRNGRPRTTKEQTKWRWDKCSIEGCDNFVAVKKEKLCTAHYLRLKRYNDTSYIKPGRIKKDFSEPWLKEDGYLCVETKDGKTKYLHRAIMEIYLGVELPPNVNVHHKDGDKLNNEISNLEIMSRAKHTSLHQSK